MAFFAITYRFLFGLFSVSFRFLFGSFLQKTYGENAQKPTAFFLVIVPSETPMNKG